MKLHIEWSRPSRLRDGKKQNMIYLVEPSKLPDAPGIYILGRRFGSGLEVLYVGQAQRVRSRVKGQMNNLRLMQSIKNAKLGKRVVIAGRFIRKPGQQQAKCLDLLERALIRYFLSEGHDLVNILGTRLRQHEVLSSGKHPKKFIPGVLYLEKKRGE